MVRDFSGAVCKGQSLATTYNEFVDNLSSSKIPRPVLQAYTTGRGILELDRLTTNSL